MINFEQAWERYKNRCLKGIAPDSVQYKETKRAFYAGAYSFHTCSAAISTLPDEVGPHIYGRIVEEIEEYIKSEVKQDVERN